MTSVSRFLQTCGSVLIAVLAMAMSANPASGQVSFGNSEKFNGGWLFSLSDSPDAASPSFDDGSWTRVVLPHDWSVREPLSPTLASCTGYLPGGIGWYRKHFAVPSGKGEKWYVYFEGIYNRSEVYLNGHLLGSRPNGYISFMYDMTPYLNESGDNVLSVRVDHSRSADSRWYTGSGIYRDVWIVSAPEVHLAQWGTSYSLKELKKGRAVLQVKVSVDKGESPAGKLSVKATLYDSEGRRVASASTPVRDTGVGVSEVSMELSVPDSELWSVDSPYLYTLSAELVCGRETVDGCRVRAGIRELGFDPDRGFALNGKWMKVKGVCLHHDAGVLGAAVPEDVWRRRLENLKSIGVNAIRMSHNPQAPAVYDLCDELGILVMDEAFDEWRFPKRKWIEGWNVGTPGFQGSADFCAAWCEADVTDMVRRDRNHPSIFLWSIGNEVDYPNDPYSHPVLDGSTISQPMFGGYHKDAPDAMELGEIAGRLAACVRAVDTSRPVTAALAGVVMSNETAYPDALDVVGYNYTEDRYDTDHAEYPERVIYGSENRPDIDAWKAVRDKDFIFGQFIWTGTDYLGESGPWPSRGFYTGLLDFGSFVKPRGHFRASLWSSEPVTYIGTYPSGNWLSVDAWDIWNYTPGEMIRVVCYTNSPQARLLLDGECVGEMKKYDDATGIIYWDIPYRPGTLRAEGCDMDGNVLSSYEIKSSMRPYALKAYIDNAASAPDGHTVDHVIVEIVDENGTKVMLGDNEITCRIDGPATLLGLEAGNNSDMTDYTGSIHRAYPGRLLCYIRRDVPGQPVKLTFTSPLLEGCTIEVR